MIRALAFLLLTVRASAVVPSGETGSHAVVGGVVRSREWIIRRSPHREEEFVGDVSYRSGPSLLTSDWALFRHELQAWQARGHVRLQQELKSGDRIDVWGETAHFDQKTGRGFLLGPKGESVRFQRLATDGEPDSGTARRLDWEGRDRGRLTGQVHVWGPRLEAWGDQADYESAAGRLVLTGGRPVVRLLQGDWTGAVQAERVAALRAPDRLQADGRARGWIKFKKKLEKLVK